MIIPPLDGLDPPPVLDSILDFGASEVSVQKSCTNATHEHGGVEAVLHHTDDVYRRQLPGAGEKCTRALGFCSNNVVEVRKLWKC